MEFKYPSVIRNVGGVVEWRLIYDPEDPNTILPNIERSALRDIMGNWSVVTTPNGQDRIFSYRIDIEVPAKVVNGRQQPQKQLRLFKVSDTQGDPRLCPPETMTIYMRENSSSSSDENQRFLDLIISNVAMSRVAEKTREEKKASQILSNAIPSPNSSFDSYSIQPNAAEKPAEPAPEVSNE